MVQRSSGRIEEVKMDYGMIAAAASIFGVVAITGGWLFRLSGRLMQTDAKADAAAKDASTAALVAQSLRISLDQNERDLVEHRVSVAREYVSKQTITELEGKLIKAIEKLGDRLDALFTGKPSTA